MKSENKKENIDETNQKILEIAEKCGIDNRSVLLTKEIIYFAKEIYKNAKDEGKAQQEKEKEIWIERYNEVNRQFGELLKKYEQQKKEDDKKILDLEKEIFGLYHELRDYKEENRKLKKQLEKKHEKI